MESRHNVAICLYWLGQPGRAIPLLEEVWDFRKENFGLVHRKTLETMQGLTQAYKSAGRNDEVEKVCEGVLEYVRSKINRENANLLDGIDAVASVYLQIQKRDLMIPLIREALELSQKYFGEESPESIRRMRKLALAYLVDGNGELALPLLRKSLEIKKRNLGHDHYETLINMRDLGCALRLNKRLDESTKMLTECIKLMESNLGASHLETLNTTIELAETHRAGEKIELALQVIEKTFAIQDASLGEAHQKWVIAKYIDDRSDEGYYRYFRGFLEGRRQRTVLLLLDTLVRNAKQPESRTRVTKLVVKNLDYMLHVRKMSPKFRLMFYDPAIGFLSRLKAYDEFEPLLRKALAIREKIQPELWSTFNNKSMLGGYLLFKAERLPPENKQSADEYIEEAETLLLDAIKGMPMEKATNPKLLAQRLRLIDRIIRLYERMEQPEKAKPWKTELEKFRPKTNQPQK